MTVSQTSREQCLTDLFVYEWKLIVSFWAGTFKNAREKWKMSFDSADIFCSFSKKEFLVKSFLNNLILEIKHLLFDSQQIKKNQPKLLYSFRKFSKYHHFHLDLMKSHEKVKK